MLPTQRALVQSLVWELNSCVPHNAAKTNEIDIMNLSFLICTWKQQYLPLTAVMRDDEMRWTLSVPRLPKKPPCLPLSDQGVCLLSQCLSPPITDYTHHTVRQWPICLSVPALDCEPQGKQTSSVLFTILLTSNPRHRKGTNKYLLNEQVNEWSEEGIKTDGGSS